MLQLIRTNDHKPLQPQGLGPCCSSQRGRRVSNVAGSRRAREYVREIVCNLIPARSSNPVVRDILEELDSEFQTRLSFRYRPEQETLDVASRDSVLSQAKKAYIVDRLWQLTHMKINAILEQRTCWAQD
jgi:hypothetical protein